MASYDECIKFESGKPQGVIRLVETNGFSRAYNHSAYLFHQVIAQHEVTRKFVKNSYCNSYCGRTVMVAKSILPEIWRVLEDGLHFLSQCFDWRLDNLKGAKQCAS